MEEMRKDFAKVVRGFVHMVWHAYNLIPVGVIMLSYILLRYTAVGEMQFVSIMGNEIDQIASDLLVAQITSSLLVISVTAMLTTKGDSVLWEDIIHYMLINPKNSNLKAITDYCFAMTIGTFWGVMNSLSVVIFVCFAFNIACLMAMAYMLLKMYFERDVIKQELEQEYFKCFKNYYDALKPFDYIKHNITRQENSEDALLVKRFEKQKIEYENELEEKTIELILEGKIGLIAENLDFLVDYKGFSSVERFFRMDSALKQEYLMRFFQYRTQKVKKVIEVFETNDLSDGHINPLYKWIYELIRFESDVDNKQLLYTLFFEKSLCQYLSSVETTDGDLDLRMKLILQFFDNRYSRDLQSILFEYVIFDDRLYNIIALNSNLGEMSGKILGQLLLSNNTNAINNIAPVVLDNKFIVTEAFKDEALKNKNSQKHIMLEQLTFQAELLLDKIGYSYE